MKRFFTALLASTVCSVASGQSVYCPAADSDMNQDGIDDIGLVVVRADGTTSGKPGEEVEVVLATDLGADSTCRIDAHLTAYSPDGEEDYYDDGNVDGTDFLIWQISQDGMPLRLSIQGRATGCTIDELPSTVVVNHLKSKPSDGTCFGSGCYELLTSELRRITYLREVGTPEEIAVSGGDRRLKIVDNNCPAPTQAERSGDDASSFEPIWDIDDFTVSQSANAETELVIIVTPTLVTPTCPETSSLYRTKIQLSFRYEAVDNNGRRIGDTVELDADTMMTKVSLPSSGSGERDYWLVNASAETEGCSAAQPNDLIVDLNQIGPDGFTTERSRVPSRMGRNPKTGEQVYIPAH
jgi:hypothetical protein